jgi:hypothetical protein
MHGDGWFFTGHGFFGLFWWVIIIALIVWLIKVFGSDKDR